MQFEDGTIGEVQLWAPGMLEAKLGLGTELYDVRRDLPGGDPQIPGLLDQERRLYESVLSSVSPEWRSLIAGISGSGPKSE